MGVLSPMTGPAARFGAIQQSTLALAVEDVNGAGGIRSLGGAKFRLIFGDTRGEADMGVTETERLITRERAHALIGAFQSGVGLPSSAVAERYEIPWLNFGTVDRITQRGFRYVFRPHANDTLKARAGRGITSLGAKHGGLKTGVILSENTEWANRSPTSRRPSSSRRASRSSWSNTTPRCARPHLDGRQGARAPARSGARQLVSRRRVADHSADGRVSAAPDRLRGRRRRSPPARFRRRRRRASPRASSAPRRGIRQWGARCPGSRR